MPRERRRVRGGEGAGEHGTDSHDAVNAGGGGASALLLGGRHAWDPAASLGRLAALPADALTAALCFVDAASLCAFGAASRGCAAAAREGAWPALVARDFLLDAQASGCGGGDCGGGVGCG